jgi:HSP20 family protein
MTPSDFGPEDDLRDWTSRIHDIMDEMCKRHFVEYRREDSWQPATDVYETREQYYICVELAGMAPEDVHVECSDQRCLAITGYRGNPRPADVTGPLSLHAMEINHGPFRREILLPELIDVAAVDATYDRGFLWVTLPKITRP